MKWKNENWLLLIVTVAVLSTYAFYIFFWMPYKTKQEKAEDERIKKEWSQKCYAQIVNQTDHEVSITMYGHENEHVVPLNYHVSAHQLVMLREDMVWDELREFPPANMVDSVLVVFDDTLNYWQIPALERTSIADCHSMYNRFDWKYTSIVVREEINDRRSYRPRLYRDGIEFVMTDLDYERATGVKRYNGQVFYEIETSSDK